MRACERWKLVREEVIVRFSSLKDKSCTKLILIGSVSLGDDDDSDIDLAIITGPGFDIKKANNVLKILKYDRSIPLHIIFFPSGMEDYLINEGGIMLCK